MKQEQRVNVVVNVGEDKLKRKKRKKRKKTGAGGGGAGAGVARQQPIVLHMPPQAQPFVPSYQPVQGFTPQNVAQEVAPITSTLTEQNVARMEAEQGTEFGTAQQYRENINIGDEVSMSDVTDFSVRDADPKDLMLHQFTRDFGRQLARAEEAQRKVGFDEKSIGQSSQGALTFVEPPAQDLSVAENEPPRTIGRRRGRPAGRKDDIPRIRRTREEVLRSRSIS